MRRRLLALEGPGPEVSGRAGLSPPAAGTCYRKSPRLAGAVRVPAVARASARKTLLHEGAGGASGGRALDGPRRSSAKARRAMVRAGGTESAASIRARKRGALCGVVLSPEEATGLVGFVGSA